MSCCADPACSHAVVAAATREATYLTDQEREIILGVLGRDELLRRDQQNRVMHLKAELQSLRRKGALKASGDWENPGPDPDKTCGRCRVELGRVINRGAFCRACRLKVCKACREYSLRTSDWVCVVCHKQMEIQAASGEWMNEFVRRPSRRRDNRVYVPAADIIKRTIRRSWTISNPTPRWSSLRSSHEFRPYSSLPRSQDINNFPSLALYQTNLKNQQNLSVEKTSPPFRRRSPTRRTQSEDVYNERSDPSVNFSMSSTSSGESQVNERPARVNPLMKLAETRPKELKTSPRRKQKSDSSGESYLTDDVTDNKSKGYPSPELSRKFEKPNIEKRVSFDSNITNKLTANVLRTQSLTDGRTREKGQMKSRTLQEASDEIHAVSEGNIAKDDLTPVELCDIEPLSGTVFRKMTVRRRRQDMRKLPAVDTGVDFLLPDGDDYKLVFISSDSSSKEEDVDDNDSSSTASSFPIDECDWDYFEPGSGTGTRTATAVLSWNSPFSSPRVYRRNVIDSPLGSPIVYRRRRTRESDTGTDEDNTRFDSGSPASSESLFQARTSSDEPLDPIRIENFSENTPSPKCKHTDERQVTQPCQNCGGGGTTYPKYIPIPVPVPIPFPVPAALWTNQETLPMFESSVNMANIDPTIASRLRVIPRSLWPYYTHAALIWPLINNTLADGTGAPATGDFSTLNSVLQNDHDTTAGTTTMPSVASDRDNSQLTTTTNSNKTNTETNGDVNKEVLNESINVNNIKAIEKENEEITGYLECENRFISSSDSSQDSSDSSETTGNENEKPRIRRVYNVNSGESQRQSDDALPSSNVTSDCDEDGRHSHSSVREEDDMSSSGSADTDSDDTGTVADRKPKKFSRIFVVNRNVSSSSSNTSSGNSDTDTSDNDTDTEMDCTVILTKIKPIEENYSDEIRVNKSDNVDDKKIDEDKDCQRITDCDNQSDDKIIKEICNLVSINDLNTDPESNIKQIKEREYMSSSPGLSDVSAESLNSSDVEQAREYTLEQLNETDDEEYDPKYSELKNDTTKDSDIYQLLVEPPQELSLSGKRSKIQEVNKVGDDCAIGKTSEDFKNANQGCGNGSVSESIKNENIVVESEKSVSAIVKDSESETGVQDGRNRRRFSEWNKIRSYDDFKVGDTTVNTRDQAGGLTKIVSSEYSARNAARYTSLVMITQEPAPSYQQVNVVTSDTTTLVPDNNDVIVQHTNWQDNDGKKKNSEEKLNDSQIAENVTVITGGDTLSAFEEGLADDDSWVENLSHEEDEDDEDEEDDDSSSGDEVTLTCSAAIDQEDELRGYHRSAIDFTLHTIVEESCEESEVEQHATTKRKERPTSATDLEKYFFFGLGDGTVPSINSNREDAISETSSIYSEGLESLGGPEDSQQQNDITDPAELASSRLEKYFLSGFMGFTAERRDSDGSVGSDSEGRPSPEQRRKRLVRARGTGRSHSSSLDNLDKTDNDHILEAQINSEDSSSSDSDTYDENNSFEKPDGQFDTVKRKKGKKKAVATSSENLETTHEVDENDKDTGDDEDGHKTPQPEVSTISTNLTTNKDQQSRDSGFIGSCDDLIREQRENNTPEVPLCNTENNVRVENITEDRKLEDKFSIPPPATSLTRKDSFNNWSSDEETNLMMCKMRQFFKTMIANSQCPPSKPGTPNLNSRMSPKPLPSPRVKVRCKPPQLVYFENELTRLMKTVPGIRDDQVREIVEYLSSEDTWSDSYDSSDYTSSDLEGAATKKALQQQISDSCKQIINKFDNSVDDEGDEGDGGIVDDSHGLNKETAFVYQKLVASLEKMATGETMNIPKLTPHNSPPLIAKVMHHIGSRLVALMHEVSSSESHASNSPKAKHYHRRLQHKISSASSTTTEDDGPDICNENDNVPNFEDAPYNLLPRSRSHDLLLGEGRNLTQSNNGVSDNVEEREASDCERFSWRGSFESALLATDSRNRLSLLGSEGSASASALAIAAKRRSAGDLLFSHKSLSREQLDRVRSCGSIGGANSEDKLWVTTSRPNRRRSSVPDASCGSGGSADGEDEDDEIETRSTLPRNLQSGPQTTNSLPRLPTNTNSNSMQKSQSMYHFLQQNVKSARYRPPGLNRLTSVPKRAVSAPGLQPSHQRRGRRSQQNVPNDDVLSEAHSSPMLASRNSNKSASPSPVAPGSRNNTGSTSSQEWHNEDDIDRLVGLQGRSSLSSLGVRSDSMASVYSGAGEGRYGTVTVRGQVEFGLQYNYKAGALEILIKQCKDLAPVDVKRNRSDPYVKVYLLPDKSKSGKRKTKVKKHTLNPVFDECLKFHISLNGLETRTLWLTVWHSDMFGRNDFLGEVMMTLENKVFDDPNPKWYNLQERTEPFEDLPANKGDIIVCLKFVPPDMSLHKKGKRSRGALHVLVKEAKCLTAVKANGTSDPFCKSYLLPEKGRSSKQKTHVARRTINPVWNYTFVYDDVTLQELSERCLELTVWDHDRLASNEFLGGVRFSLGTGKHYGKTVEWMDACGKELNLWKSMLERPNFWVEGCVSLRPTLDTRLL